MLGDKSEISEELNAFLAGKTSANKILLPLLTRRFPNSVSQSDRFVISDEAIRLGLKDLSNISFRKPHSSILGDAYQALIGPKMRGDKGQFFTPRELIKLMV